MLLTLGLKAHHLVPGRFPSAPTHYFLPVSLFWAAAVAIYIEAELKVPPRAVPAVAATMEAAVAVEARRM